MKLMRKILGPGLKKGFVFNFLQKHGRNWFIIVKTRVMTIEMRVARRTFREMRVVMRVKKRNPKSCQKGSIKSQNVLKIMCVKFNYLNCIEANTNVGWPIVKDILYIHGW